MMLLCDVTLRNVIYEDYVWELFNYILKIAVLKENNF